MKTRYCLPGLMLAPMAAMAIGPAPITHVLRQADGTEIHAQLKGGPLLNWYEDESGHLLVQKSGNWYYGKAGSQGFKATTVLARPGATPPADALVHYRASTKTSGLAGDPQGLVSTFEMSKKKFPPPVIKKLDVQEPTLVSAAEMSKKTPPPRPKIKKLDVQEPALVSAAEMSKQKFPPPVIKKLDVQEPTLVSAAEMSKQKFPPPVIKKLDVQEPVLVSTLEMSKQTPPPRPKIKKLDVQEPVLVSTLEMSKQKFPPPVIKKLDVQEPTLVSALEMSKKTPPPRPKIKKLDVQEPTLVSAAEMSKQKFPPPVIKKLDVQEPTLVSAAEMSKQKFPPPVIKKLDVQEPTLVSALERSKKKFPPPIIKKLDTGLPQLQEGGAIRVPLLTLVVSFNDVQARSDFGSLLWWSDKSLAAYFHDQTGGKLQLVPALGSDGIVQVQLDRDHPSCGGHCGYGLDGTLAQALAQADTELDFSRFDRNGDGRLSPDELAVQFIFAGNEAAASGNDRQAIWAQSRTMPAVTLDGERLDSYAALGEMQWGHRATLGVMARQLGQLLLGLPDLPKGSSLGDQDLMGQGAWQMAEGDSYLGQSPAPLGAWALYQAGLVSPKVLSQSGNYDLAAGQVALVYLDQAKPEQGYLLLEVRSGDNCQQDSCRGLMITRVDATGPHLVGQGCYPGAQGERQLAPSAAVRLSAISDAAGQMRFSLNLEEGEAAMAQAKAAGGRPGQLAQR
ncbi:EF-hand domain-containing protein [Gallaecimonas kandeliae]|uniref:EF-hand domain-containing protein n=1 Tax=Gallaecimonas kandeliae TaxID=3029055 RepID=UPI002647D88F|nr:EF-hand domain-containing protein [Gallaecimonas kandeliae]WKE64635.1 EF-hand domain-containing protein [Gallaecimonas kandeliae]